MRAELEVFVNRELGADAPAFWDVSDAAAHDVLGRHPSQGAAAECDIAAPAQPTGARAQRRRLARAVGAEQRHDASFGDGERDPVENGAWPVTRMDLRQLHELSPLRGADRGFDYGW